MPEEPTPIIPPEGPDQSFTFGKGCMPTPKEILDTRYRLAVPVGAPVIDWSVPFRVPAALVQKNQKSSSSCTGQATNYYVEVLNQIEHGVSELYSARHNYSQVSLGHGRGAFIPDAMRIPITQGAAALNSVPEGDSTEDIMIDPSDNHKAILEAKTDKYAVIPNAGGIDALAQIVKDYHGFVTGFNGWNGMFAPDGTVVDWSKWNWGHAVYVCGYEMRNGQKCLVFKNSWGSSWGDGGYGYFPEAFVTSGMMFDAFVYALVEDLDPNSMIKFVRAKDTAEVWLVRDGKRTHIDNATALTIISDFSQVQEVTQAELNAIPLNLIGDKPLGLSATVND